MLSRPWQRSLIVQHPGTKVPTRQWPCTRKHKVGSMKRQMSQKALQDVGIEHGFHPDCWGWSAKAIKMVEGSCLDCGKALKMAAHVYEEGARCVSCAYRYHMTICSLKSD